MSVFTTPQKIVSVEVNYIVTEDGELVIVSEPELVKDDLKKTIKIAKADFSYENWSEFNRCMKMSLSKDPLSGEVVFDPVALKDYRLKRLLKKLTDGEGNNIEINEKEIGSWSPDFCMALMDSYNKKLERKSSEVFKTFEEAAEYFKGIIEKESEKIEKKKEEELKKEREKEKDKE
jgi:hypothetical protein